MLSNVDKQYLEERGWRCLGEQWADMSPGESRTEKIAEFRNERTNELEREVRQCVVPSAAGLCYSPETALSIEQGRSREPLPMWETFLSRSGDPSVCMNRWRVRDRQKQLRKEEFLTLAEANAFIESLVA